MVLFPNGSDDTVIVYYLEKTQCRISMVLGLVS